MELVNKSKRGVVRSCLKNETKMSIKEGKSVKPSKMEPTLIKSYKFRGKFTKFFTKFCKRSILLPDETYMSACKNNPKKKKKVLGEFLTMQKESNGRCVTCQGLIQRKNRNEHFRHYTLENYRKKLIPFIKGFYVEFKEMITRESMEEMPKTEGIREKMKEIFSVSLKLKEEYYSEVEIDLEYEEKCRLYYYSQLQGQEKILRSYKECFRYLIRKNDIKRTMIMFNEITQEETFKFETKELFVDEMKKFMKKMGKHDDNFSVKLMYIYFSHQKHQKIFDLFIFPKRNLNFLMLRRYLKEIGKKKTKEMDKVKIMRMYLRQILDYGKERINLTDRMDIVVDVSKAFRSELQENKVFHERILNEAVEVGEMIKTKYRGHDGSSTIFKSFLKRISESLNAYEIADRVCNKLLDRERSLREELCELISKYDKEKEFHENTAKNDKETIRKMLSKKCCNCAKLKKLLNEEREKMLCKLCLTNTVNQTMLDCGHAICKSCVHLLKKKFGRDTKCPWCRKKVIEFKNLYIS